LHYTLACTTTGASLSAAPLIAIRDEAWAQQANEVWLKYTQACIGNLFPQMPIAKP
jgi:hypothetical protein